jgi:hypothetical protein
MYFSVLFSYLQLFRGSNKFQLWQRGCEKTSFLLAALIFEFFCFLLFFG